MCFPWHLLLSELDACKGDSKAFDVKPQAVKISFLKINFGLLGNSPFIPIDILSPYGISISKSQREEDEAAKAKAELAEKAAKKAATAIIKAADNKVSVEKAAEIAEFFRRRKEAEKHQKIDLKKNISLHLEIRAVSYTDMPLFRERITLNILNGHLN